MRTLTHDGDLNGANSCVGSSPVKVGGFVIATAAINFKSICLGSLSHRILKRGDGNCSLDGGVMGIFFDSPFSFFPKRDSGLLPYVPSASTCMVVFKSNSVRCTCFEEKGWVVKLTFGIVDNCAISIICGSS